MREGAITDGGSRNRREPAVKHGKLSCQRRQNRQLVGREVVHNIVRALRAAALLEIAIYKALHIRHARFRVVSIEYLQIDRRGSGVQDQCLAGLGTPREVVRGSNFHLNRGCFHFLGGHQCAASASNLPTYGQKSGHSSLRRRCALDYLILVPCLTSRAG